MDETNIVEITSEGLTYVDEHEDSQYIEFAACYQRYTDGLCDPNTLKRYKEANPDRGEEWLKDRIEWMKTLKEIGYRDFTIPYIQLHTDPPTRFRFSSQEAYGKVLTLITKKAGWRLRDLG